MGFTLRTAEIIDRTIGPAYNCHRCDRPQREVATGCPTCALVVAIGNRERQMPWEWARFVHEDWNDGSKDLPAVRRVFGAVTEALKALPEGARVDPSWPAEIAELATIYHEEVAQFRREREREAADRARVNT